MSPTRCQQEFERWFENVDMGNPTKGSLQDDLLMVGKLRSIAWNAWQQAWKLGGNLAFNAANGR